MDNKIDYNTKIELKLDDLSALLSLLYENSLQARLNTEMIMEMHMELIRIQTGKPIDDLKNSADERIRELKDAIAKSHLLKTHDTDQWVMNLLRKNPAKD